MWCGGRVGSFEGEGKGAVDLRSWGRRATVAPAPAPCGDWVLRVGVGGERRVVGVGSSCVNFLPC